MSKLLTETNWYDVGQVVLTPDGYGATVKRYGQNNQVEVEYQGGIKKVFQFNQLKPFTQQRSSLISPQQAKGQFGNVPHSVQQSTPQQTSENFMKKNLEVKQFSLKQIVENLGRIPKDGGAKFGDETPRLSSQQKRELMEKVGNFNELGKVLRCETAIMDLAKQLTEIGTMAESYAMTESSDYFQAEVVKRDFKEVKNIIKEFQKLARECNGGLVKLNALYEDMGSKMQRYFEIKSLDEIANAINTNASAPAPQIGEIADEEEECGMEENLQENAKKSNN